MTQFNIRIPNHILPVYANFAVLDTSKDEVFIAFCCAEGGVERPDAQMVQKIVMTPANLKNLHASIGELLENYQLRHGRLE